MRTVVFRGPASSRLAFVLAAVVTLSAGPSWGQSSQTNVENMDRRALLPQLDHEPLERPSLPPVGRVHWDDRMGQPTIVWPIQGPDTTVAAGSSDAIAAARLYLSRYAPYYDLNADDVLRARVDHVHDLGRGAIAVIFTQQVDGREVFGLRQAVVMNRALELVGLSGYLSPLGRSEFGHPEAFESYTGAMAVAAAYSDRFSTEVEPSAIRTIGAGQADYTNYRLDSGHALLGSELSAADVVRAKPVYMAFPGALEPAYYLELVGTRIDGGLDGYAYVVSAVDGTILRRSQLVHEASFQVFADESGRPLPYPIDGVYPHPTGSFDYAPEMVGDAPSAADFGLANFELQDVPNGLFGVDVPWVEPAENPILLGNNAFAYVDVGGDDGYDDGIDLILSSPGDDVFSNAFDPTLAVDLDQNSATALTQAFYVVNWLHDYFYAHGFTEELRNAQDDNFGRGGLGGDYIRVETQDFSGRNNANMYTPADGVPPRMQMYTFGSSLQVLRAPEVGIVFEGGAATFGPTATVNGTLQLVYGEGVSGLSNGCNPLSIDLSGLIGVFELSGQCSADVVILNAQAAGAIGVLLGSAFDPSPLSVQGLGCGNCPAGYHRDITIPALHIARSDILDYVTLVDGMGGSLDNVTLDFSRPMLDGALDTGVVVHEWGHFLVGRLVGSPSNNQGGSLNEGLADFVSLLVLARETDSAVSGNESFEAPYPVGQWATLLPYEQLYFGIRRAPYSPRFDVNPFTFIHIANGVSPPGGAPLLFYAPDFNAEVHASGEVIANMLWSGLNLLIAEHGFTEAQERMSDYLVLALATVPGEPTFTEMRDAFILAAAGSSATDAALLWQAFAARGMGLSAQSPERFSVDHAGVVQSFDEGAVLRIGGVAAGEDPADNCDADGVWDVGEQALIQVTVENVGSAAAVDTDVVVRTTSTGVSFPMGSSTSLASLDALTGQTVTFPVVLEDSIEGAYHSFSIEVSNPSAEPTITSFDFDWRTELDFEDTGSTSEDFEGPVVWQSVGVTRYPRNDFWRLDSNRPGQSWVHAGNPANQSDVRLISPELQVSEDADLVLSFRHRFDFAVFSFAPGTPLDGGVIELTRDGGETWEDISVYADPGYTAHLLTAQQLGLLPDQANSLADRDVYGRRSASYPELQPVRIDLGDQLAGATIQIQFRAVSDVFLGAEGWDVDDVAFEGLANAPFPLAVPEDELCVDTPPVANGGEDRFVQSGDVVFLDGNASFDPRDEGLSYAWTQTVGTPVDLQAADTALASFIAPRSPAFETLEFELTVTAGDRVSEPDTVAVDVLPVNAEPIADAGEDQQVAEGTSVSLNGSASDDADGDDLGYIWIQIAGPGVVLDDPHAAEPVFTAPDVDDDATLAFELTVSDGRALSDADTVEVTVVNDNLAPIADAGPDLSALDGDTIELDGERSADPEGAPLTFSWSQTAGPAVELVGADLPIVAFEAVLDEGAEDPLDLTFELVVDDGDLTGIDTVDVRIRPVPVIVETETVTVTVTETVTEGCCAVGGTASPPSPWLVAVTVVLAAWPWRRRRRRKP